MEIDYLYDDIEVRGNNKNKIYPLWNSIAI